VGGERQVAGLRLGHQGFGERQALGDPALFPNPHGPGWVGNRVTFERIDPGTRPVTVPADIGIVFKNGQAVAISPLHTHTPDGVLHVEAERNAKFTLGQLFTEWGVRLSSTCVGGLCADGSHEIAFAVDGVPYEGDPGEIALKPHEEIAIVYGAKGNLPKPPASYNFPKGL